jgi:hypothetical protein
MMVEGPNCVKIKIIKSRGSAVAVVTGYVLDDRRVRVRILVGSRIFNSPLHPGRLWGLSSGYRVFFPGGKADRA